MQLYKLKYWVILSLIILAGCSKDKGNYSYQNINEMSIGGIEPDYSVITAIDTLKIQPALDQSLPSADKELVQYYWIIRGVNQFVDTISTASTLSYPIDFVPGNYTLQYRVVDKGSGVSWWKNTNIKVSTPYSRGILLIGENERHNGEAEMISMVSDTLVVTDILAKSGLPVLHDPVDFVFAGGWDNWVKLWVFSHSGGYYLDRLSMKGDVRNTFSNLVYTNDPINPKTLYPIVIAPQIISSGGGIGTVFYRVMLCDDGSIFTTYLQGNGDYYTNPVNRTPDHMDKLLKAAPYLLYSLGSMSSVTWYDTDNKRFMNLSNFALTTASNKLTDEVGDVFPWDQSAVKRDLVYAENTRNTDGGSTYGNSFAIFKDPGGTHFIYEFYGNGPVPAKRAMYKILPIATDFSKADFYAFSSNRTVLFYSVGSTLYAYDYNPGHEKFYTFPEFSGDEITMLKFDTQMDYLDNSLYLATYNTTTKGRLRRLKMGANPNIVQLTPVDKGEWQGLIKIKNMNWRPSD